MFDDIFNTLINLLQLLLILHMRLFHRRTDRRSLVMGILERLILSLDGVVSFLKEGKSSIIDPILRIS